MELSGNNISVIKGDSGMIVFSFKEKCKDFALDGYTVKFIIKKEKSAPDETALFSQNFTVDKLGNNFITVPVETTLTDRQPDTFYYGLRLVKDTSVHTVLEGNFVIEQGVFE